MNEREIFIGVLQEESLAAQQAFLDNACGSNAELRRRVEGLLRDREKAADFLLSPAPWLIATADDAIRERPGTVIGPYKLLEEIGEGGMGLVFVAEQQQPVRRKVALKVIKPGMDSRQVIARFEAERQALAMMDHPNIAKVYDGGATPEGRPYFVMELVKGTPITEFCDRYRLTNRQRLQLFLDVCHAVQHAHQKGIIHRDLKPSNILVSLHDVTPVVKVIDFGIAKSISGRLTDGTVYTALAQMVGTPMYMSPEQAGLSDIDVDTRSDVYSLGVLLYELLTGTTPFDREQLKKLSYDEIRRIIREDEPPRPSTRLSTIEQAALSTLAERRGLEPHRLSQQVRGELDWIVMKALEKDRTRRFESASAFAADVQRYLDDEPVLACPPSKLYRLGKLFRRHKAVLGVVAVLLLAVVTLGGGIGWVARDRSTRQAVAAARVSDALDESERLYRSGKVPEALNVAQRAEGLLDTSLADKALAARVQERIEDLQMVLKLEEVGVAIQRKRSAEYEQLFRRYGIDLAAQPAEEIAARVRGRLIASDLVAALDQLAVGFFSLDQSPQEHSSPWKLELMALTRQVDPDPWRDRVRQAIERGNKAALQDLTRTAPLDQLPPVTLRTIAIGLGTLTFEERTRASEKSPTPKPLARDFLRRALQHYPSDLWLNWLLADDLQYGLPRDPKEAAAHYRTLAALRPKSPEIYFRLAQLMAESKQLDDAITYLRKSIAVDPHFFWGYINLAQSLADKGQMDEADVWLHKAIALKYDDFGSVVVTDAAFHAGVGRVFFYMRRWDESIVEFKEAIRLEPDHTGTTRGLLADAHYFLGNSLADKGRLDEAIAKYQEAIRIQNDFPEAHTNLGNCLYSKGQLDEALAEYQKALRTKRDFPEADNAHFALGRALRDKGRLDEAIAEYREAIKLFHGTLALRKAKLGHDHPDTLASMMNLANSYGALGRHADAVKLREEALALYQAKLGLDNPDTLGCMYNLAQSYGALGRHADALKLNEEMLALRKAKLGFDHPDTLRGMMNLANSYGALGRHAEALKLHEKTLELQRAKLGPAHPDTLMSMNNLAESLATASDAKLRDPMRALRLAKAVVQHTPMDGGYWSTLGVVCYRAGDWSQAIEALEKSEALSPGQFVAHNCFFLAMAHWQRGNQADARKWYERAAEWMEKNNPKDAELRRLREEASKLLGVSESQAEKKKP